MKGFVRRCISAAHFLPDYPGPCKKIHGHTWEIHVWLEGEVNPRTGMLVDFKVVKDLIDTYDHQNLNDIFPDHHPPTAENFALALYGIIPHCVKVRVWESEDAYAEMP